MIFEILKFYYLRLLQWTPSDFLQAGVLVTAIAYKIGFAYKKFWGWILSMVCTILSFMYQVLYVHKPILTMLEITFFSLSIYGAYKSKTKNLKSITNIDMVIISLSLISITILTILEIHLNTVAYQVVASVSFLIGTLLLAQNKIEICQLFGWTCYLIGNYCLYVFYSKDQNSSIIMYLQGISMGIAIYCMGISTYKVIRRSKIL